MLSTVQRQIWPTNFPNKSQNPRETGDFSFAGNVNEV